VPTLIDLLVARNDGRLLSYLDATLHTITAFLFLWADYLHLTLPYDMKPVEARFILVLLLSTFRWGYRLYLFCYPLSLLLVLNIYLFSNFCKLYYRYWWVTNTILQHWNREWLVKYFTTPSQRYCFHSFIYVGVTVRRDLVWMVGFIALIRVHSTRDYKW
jgi:hypothetical protein